MTTSTQTPDAAQIVQDTYAFVMANPPNFIGDVAMLPYPKQVILDACRSLLSSDGRYLVMVETLAPKIISEWHQIDAEDKAVVAQLNRKPHPKLDHEVGEFMPVVKKYMRRALFG